jgi:hypothetical protein
MIVPRSVTCNKTC